MTGMGIMPIPTRNSAVARRRQLKQAILEVCANADTPAASLFTGFSEDDWQGVLRWLDMSGMALYFIDRVRRSGLGSSLPERILRLLDLRLERNRERTRAMLEDVRMLAGWFDAASIEYALLKGISLTPDSVPANCLRWQADLDFLVRRKDSRLACDYISRLGYRLRLDTGDTVEFIWGSARIKDVAELYCAESPRAFELHIAQDDSDVRARDVLARRRTRLLEGIELSTLSPTDILVRQALHLSKHLCGERTRISWVLEFKRHVEARRGDAAFWAEVESIANQEDNAGLAISMALWLAREFFGPLYVDHFDHRKADRLPARVRMWLQRYAHDVLISDSIASKHYTLLRAEIPGQACDSKSLRRLLIPLHLPFRITMPSPRETLAGRVGRWVTEARHFFTRLRFHAIEGLWFAIEASRWRKAVARCEEAGPSRIIAGAGLCFPMSRPYERPEATPDEVFPETVTR